MIKHLITRILFIGLILGMFSYSSAQQQSTLTATLDSQTPQSTNITQGAQYFDVARITISASGGDFYINGFYLATDVPGGLSNFSNIFIYNAQNNNVVGSYPNQSENPSLVQINPIIVGSGMPRIFLIKVNLAPSAAGNVRVGFTGFTFPTQATPTVSGVPIYGNVMTLPGTIITPTPASIPSPTPTPPPTGGSTPTPSSLGFTNLAALELQEGNTVSAVGSSDPDIYIVNEHGYKRLFLNPVIFGFYGHLGGFAEVRTIVPATRDVLVTSSLFRNCETNDSKVYGVEVTGEDSGVLHWVNTSGSQAVADDPDFFKKVFCINTAEFNWYTKGADYTSVIQVPLYSR